MTPPPLARLSLFVPSPAQPVFESISRVSALHLNESSFDATVRGRSPTGPRRWTFLLLDSVAAPHGAGTRRQRQQERGWVCLRAETTEARACVGSN
ncbi:MAG: hypothetical protein ACPIOQ_61140, partial [Promethearchaeia archaeon]